MRKLAVIVGASGLLVLVLGLFSLPTHRASVAAAESPRPATVDLTVRSLKGGRPVPRSFFGLSTEYWTLPLYERKLRVFERVVSALHVRGNGPMLLRIGGDSADHVRWEPRSRPSWVYAVTPHWLRATRALVDRMHLRVLLDLNLITGSPGNAAELARASEQQLRGHLAGFEVGNEPDIYDRTFWVGALAWGRRRAPLPAHLSAGAYRRDFALYAHDVHRVPLVGPALANPRFDVRWIADLLRAPHPDLRMVSIHHYALSACAHPRAANYPTIGRVLSERASAGAARSLAGDVALAHHAGLPIRLTELNSVTCGGLRGVSNSFATALWAPDALFELMRAGIDGVNLHVREYAINAPFMLTAQGLLARPLLYGMIAFVRMLGPGARLVPLALSDRPAVHIKAWAVSLRDHQLRLLLIDKGVRGADVRLRLPTRGPAGVERLTAPSVRATTAVTLAGQRLSAGGRWVGRRVVERITPRSSFYELSLPAHSAALVSVR